MFRNLLASFSIFTLLLVAAPIAIQAADLDENTPPGQEQQAEGERQLICHATGSDQNPYLVLEVDGNGQDGNGNNDHSNHEGDIIPINDMDGDGDVDADDCLLAAGEDPTDEDPTDEDPTDEDPTDEDPTDEDPTDEDPTDEDPTDEDPTDEDPTDEGPTDEDPTDGGQLICHATGSEENPYLLLELDANGQDGEGNNDHSNHEGDIIPITDLDGDGDVDVDDCNFTGDDQDDTPEDDPEDEDGEDESTADAQLVCHAVPNVLLNTFAFEVVLDDASVDHTTHENDIVPITDLDGDGDVDVDDCNFVPEDDGDDNDSDQFVCHAIPDTLSEAFVYEVMLDDGTVDHTTHENDIIPITDRDGDGDVDVTDCLTPPQDGGGNNDGGGNDNGGGGNNNGGGGGGGGGGRNNNGSNADDDVVLASEECTEAPFSDIDEHEFEEAIIALYCGGAVHGFNDNLTTFGADEDTLYSDLAKMTTRWLGLAPSVHEIGSGTDQYVEILEENNVVLAEEMTEEVKHSSVSTAEAESLMTELTGVEVKLKNTKRGYIASVLHSIFGGGN